MINNTVSFLSNQKIITGALGIMILFMAFAGVDNITWMAEKKIGAQQPKESATLQNYKMIVNYSFSWIDAAGGTRLTMNNVDDGNQMVSLPFTFTFYNTSFTSVYICTNGFVNFQTSSNSYSNMDFPLSSPVYMIAGYWEDLHTANPCNIFYQSFAGPNRFVIEYQNYYTLSGWLVGTFEIVLYESGDILFNYQNITYMNGATTGLNYGVDTAYYTQFTGLNNSVTNFALGFSTGTVPDAPQNFIASPGNAQVTLTWQAPLNNGGSTITKYLIYRGTSAGSEVLVATLGTVLTYNDTPLVNGQIYYYKVSAVNILGEGVQSGESFTTPASKPGVPRNLVAEAGHGYVTLAWQPPASDGGSAITHYRVYRGTSSGGETFFATIGVVLMYTDTSVTNGQTYYYRLSANNSVGEGSQATEVSAMPSIALSIPSPPWGLVATPGNGQVTLAWQAPASDGGAAITHYRVYRGTSTGGEILVTTLGNVLAYTDTPVTNGQVLYYKVSANNSIGESALSNEASALPGDVPGPPQNLIATPGNGQVTLAWQAPSSNGGSVITRYLIYRGSSSGNEVLVATLGTVLTWTDPGLTNGQIYYYKISAVNNFGEGPTSSEVYATPATAGSPIPLNLILLIGVIIGVVAGIAVIGVIIRVRKKNQLARSGQANKLDDSKPGNSMT